ncbi:MAG: hypothetical protein SFY95_12300 [Planctomycetota bacterium]|nr:hypothetical protein [Planctomycetota bacterium]
MGRVHTGRAGIIAACVGLTAGLPAGMTVGWASASAWAAQPEQPAQQPAEKLPEKSADGSAAPAPEGNVLGGPTVTEAESGPASLIERDFMGKVKRLEQPAEEAALARLKLDAATRAKVDGVLNARAAKLDKIVMANITLLLKAQSAQATGDRAEQADVVRELGEALKPLREGGRLRDQLAAQLPEKERREFTRMVDSYWRAIVDEGVKENEASGKREGRLGVFSREALKALGTEVKRSYERQIQSRLADLESFMKVLDLPPERDARVRTVISQYAQQALIKPDTMGYGDAKARRTLFNDVLKELTPEERQRLLAELARRSRGETGAE